MKYTRSGAIVLLIFLALGALWGSITLIVDADGVPFGLFHQSLLSHSPFHSYLVPGIVLLFANGLLPLGILWLAFKRTPRYGLWIALQGCVLLGFLGIECWMLQALMWAHYLYAAIAALLIACGLILWREESLRIPVTEEKPPETQSA